MDDEGSFTTLPRGRHHLSREQVRASQRERLLCGMIDTVAAVGYARTTVADVLKRGRVSRETFYQHFTDKEDCFLAVLDHSAEGMVRLFDRELGDDTAVPIERFEQALEVYLDTLAARPAVARVFFLESYAAGPAAQRKRFAVQERFVTAVVTNFRDVSNRAGLPDPEFACRLLVASISTLVAAELVADRAGELPALRPSIMALIRHVAD